MCTYTSNCLSLIQPLKNTAPTRYGGGIILSRFGAVGLCTAPGVVGPHHIFENERTE